MLVLGFTLCGVGARASAETGYDLWLRYGLVADAAALEAYRRVTKTIVVPSTSETANIIRAELRRGLTGLTGVAPEMEDRVERDGAILVGTPTTPGIGSLRWADTLTHVGPEGYMIRSARVSGRQTIVVASEDEIGALYGVFHLLRLMQTGVPLSSLDIVERPRIERRMLNHWDNLDGSIERGYAGASLWAWDELPGRVDPRIADYARANASLGLNGTVLNNVNADPRMLTRPYLEKAAAIARALRPYGIRIYLSANFATPKSTGGLPTADPLDAAVVRWWREKADEIYRLIPDFGGFVVKANSEGQPGPQDYQRTHADGANVLADALKPHNGIVLWRAFVYSADVDPDRIKRAYLELQPLDGRFRDNVLVQVKNGPLDFQPREPFHPLFGAMPRTPLAAELQITQEYLGHSTHLVYLAPMWKELLDADTFTAHPGTAASTVSTVIDGSAHGYRATAIAGVANTGRDMNWSGHHFAQANWYAYGRLAWNPDAGAAEIADEWIAMTWSRAADVIPVVRSMMLDSREAFVRYTMPLGLHHLIGGDHYAPMPENPDPRRADWSAIYYHRADASGIGVDRSTRGTRAVEQYRSPLRERWNDPRTTPDTLLLWFHRLPWDYKLASGETLWDAIVRHYTRGAEEAASLEARWTSLRGKVDVERHEAVAAKLRQQTLDAAAWRDKCLKYFQQFSQRPIGGRTP